MARKHPTRKKPSTLTPEVIDRIVAAALAHPEFGAQRLMRHLTAEGLAVSRSSIYRALRKKGLHTREFRVQFLKKREHPGTSDPECEPQDVGAQPAEPNPCEPGAALSEPSPEPKEESGPDTSSRIPPPFASEHRRAAALAPAISIPSSRTTIARKSERSASGREKWFFISVDLLLACLIVWLGIRLAGMLYMTEEELTADVEPALEPMAAADPFEASADNRPLADYSAIVDRNLFATTRASQQDAVGEAFMIEKIETAEPGIGLKLIGTAVTRDRLLNYAVLEITKTRSQGIYREKDRVEDVFIKKILRGNVIIVTNRGEFRLTADEKNAGAERSAPPRTDQPSLSTPQTPYPEDPEKEVRLEIALDDIAQSLDGLNKMLEESNSAPHATDGKPDGFSIGRLRAHDILYRIGLRTGDILKDVGGKKIDNLEGAQLLIDRLAEGGDLSILIERRGQQQKLNLSIK